MRGSKSKWQMINKLQGKTRERKKELKLYRENGGEVEESKCEEVIGEFWEQIYRKNGDKMEDVWDLEQRRQYSEDLAKSRAREEDPSELWLPKVGDQYANVRVMDMEVKEEDVVRALQSWKARRAGGLDGVKPEMFKELQKSENDEAGYGEGNVREKNRKTGEHQGQ